MITSTKNYTEKDKNKPKKNQTDRTLGQMVKAKLHRQNHTKKHTHTQLQKEKKEKNIYIYIHFFKKGRAFPWWRSGGESACQCRGHGFEPWSGKIPHAAEQLGP